MAIIIIAAIRGSHTDTYTILFTHHRNSEKQAFLSPFYKYAASHVTQLGRSRNKVKLGFSDYNVQSLKNYLLLVHRGQN